MSSIEPPTFFDVDKNNKYTVCKKLYLIFSYCRNCCLIYNCLVHSHKKSFKMLFKNSLKHDKDIKSLFIIDYNESL